MKVVIDSCSIILMAKATVLEEFVKWKESIITEQVYCEVMEGKEKKLFDALLLSKLVDEKKILKNNPKGKEMAKKLMDDFGLGKGEAESIAVAIENNSPIITDNKQGRKAAKIYGMALLGSIDVITALYKVKKITKEKAVNALKSLKEHGWFNDYLIENALEDIKNG